MALYSRNYSLHPTKKLVGVLLGSCTAQKAVQWSLLTNERVVILTWDTVGGMPRPDITELALQNNQGVIKVADYVCWLGTLPAPLQGCPAPC